MAERKQERTGAAQASKWQAAPLEGRAAGQAVYKLEMSMPASACLKMNVHTLCCTVSLQLLNESADYTVLTLIVHC